MPKEQPKWDLPMPVEITKLSKLKNNPDNPREITEEKFADLQSSIETYPNGLFANPIIYTTGGIILSGNMRFRAAKALGWKEAPAMNVSALSPEDQKAIIFKLNTIYGKYDFDRLANDWDPLKLKEYHVPVWTYEAELNPSANHNQITDKDISNAEEKSKNVPSGEAETIDCMCPNCGHEFEVRK